MNRRDVFEMTMCLPFKLLHCLLDYHFLNSISMTALLFFTEKSYELSSAMSKYDNIESELEIVEKFDESQLEETCVLVEEERIHVPHGPIKHKSYKKKLREAFSTKKRLTRKEYEKLGALYGDQQFNLEAEDKVMPVLAMNSNTKLLSANDHPESEWEIL